MMPRNSRKKQQGRARKQKKWHEGRLEAFAVRRANMEDTFQRRTREHEAKMERLEARQADLIQRHTREHEATMECREAIRAELEVLDQSACLHGGLTGAGAVMPNRFFHSLVQNIQLNEQEDRFFEDAMQKTVLEYEELFENESFVAQLAKCLLARGTECLLSSNDCMAKDVANILIILYSAPFAKDDFRLAREFRDLHEDTSNRSLISFFASKIPCSCLDGKKQEAKERPKQSCCDHCRQEKEMASTMLCGKCKLTQYCSAGCQQAAWPDHKPLCKVLREMQRKRRGG